MKKFNFIFAIAMMVVAAASVAVVSCKKDTTGQDNAKGVATQTFDPRQIEDMNAYLKDFKQRMQSATKGDDEALSLEDAAWHLACLANFDLCNINVHFNDVRFDTLAMQVDVTDGGVMMGDLRTAYEQMLSLIRKFEDGLDLDGKNLRFVNVGIDGSGMAQILLMTSFSSNEKYMDTHQWYYSAGSLDSICDIYFDENGSFAWQNGAVKSLRSVINVLEGNLYIPGNPQPSAYIPTRSYVFNYNLWIDPYTSPFYFNSRLFSQHYNGSDPDPFYIESDTMCYCLDSYIGLGFDYLDSNPSGIANERPVYWQVTADTLTDLNIINHILTVQYGRPCIIGPIPDPN